MVKPNINPTGFTHKYYMEYWTTFGSFYRLVEWQRCVRHHDSHFQFFSADRTTSTKICDLPNSRMLNSMVQSKFNLVAFKAARLALLIFKSTGVMEWTLTQPENQNKTLPRRLSDISFKKVPLSPVSKQKSPTFMKNLPKNFDLQIEFGLHHRIQHPRIR